MALYRDDAVVLRVQKLGEADRIITLLTRRHGRVRAVAKGVRKTTSRFGARLEPFSHVDLQLYEGRSLDVVNQAEGITPYGKHIVSDYGRYTSASAVLETAERLTGEEREPALRLFLLTIGALRSIADGAHAPGLVLDAYLLRSSRAGRPRSGSARSAAYRGSTGPFPYRPAGRCVARAARRDPRPRRPPR
jgi:DNA repair protein RecO (recombination protein O)